MIGWICVSALAAFYAVLFVVLLLAQRREDRETEQWLNT